MQVPSLSSGCENRAILFRYMGAKIAPFCFATWVRNHVGNNISETYPRRIGQGLNYASCILISMLSSLMGLPNPAWVSLGNVVSHMGAKSRHFLFTMKLEPSQPTQTTSGFGVGCILPKSSFGGAWNLR
jgi:hypothetical protein